jgi:tetratricopeptide (TPR) repeat protein
VKRGLLVAAVAVGASLASAARAQSIWDVVRDPRVGVAARLLRDAELHRAPPGMPRGLDPKIDALLDQQTAVIFELRGGAELPGVEPALFLGDLLIGARSGREAEGRRLLLHALERAPDHPLANRAWFAVAIASNVLGDPAMELRAYSRALEVEWDEEARSRIHLNRGETRMLSGDLSGAQRDYETSLTETSSSEGWALAHWGLAVCFARQGDLPAALGHAGQAASLRFPGLGDRQMLAIELPGVFFTPEHEIFYYRALGLLALARDLPPVDAEPLYARAVADWDEYLGPARAAREPWVGAAEQQRAYTARQLERARAAARKARH